MKQDKYMPKIGNKKFSYTKKGKAAAKKAKKKMSKMGKATGGRMR